MIRRASILCLLLFAASVGIRAQCPKINVSSPSEVEADEPITFTAAVTGTDRDNPPTFNWTISDGIISSGPPGTSVITVDTTGIEGMSVTATVHLGGLERRCANTASSTTGVKPKPQPARKFDEYGTLRLADRNSHLDNYAIQLQNEPMSQGYVIGYSGRKSLPGAAAKSSSASKTYLGDIRGIEYSRIVTIDGGYREQPMTELWIVPEGSKPPLASPTIDPSEIKAPAKKKPATKRPPAHHR